MANNQYVNKVVYNDSTLIDLTEDTITPESLLSGYTAHDRSGASINGTAVIPTKVSDLQDDVGYLVETDIINNLTISDATMVASQAEAYALNEAITQSTAALTTREDLTVTYTQNQYVTSSDMGISVKRIGKAYAIDGNLWLSNEYSANNPVEICRIINYNAAKPIRMQIPNGAYTMLLTIYDNGIIAFGRVSSSLAAGWYRFGATAVKYN